MTDYFEYTDRREDTIERLLIWWGTREPFVHTDDCDGEGMHCCNGKNYGLCLQSIEGVSFAFRRDEPIPLYFRSHPLSEQVLMEPGDRIYYCGDHQFELVRVR